MSNSSHEAEGYFGISFLDIDRAAANSVIRRVRLTTTNLTFDTAEAKFDGLRQSLTIEGDAHSLSSPTVAINALSRSVEAAKIIASAGSVSSRHAS